MTCVARMHGYTIEHVEQALHAVLEPKCVEATVEVTTFESKGSQEILLKLNFDLVLLVCVYCQT